MSQKFEGASNEYDRTERDRRARSGQSKEAELVTERSSVLVSSRKFGRPRIARPGFAFELKRKKQVRGLVCARRCHSVA